MIVIKGSENKRKKKKPVILLVGHLPPPQEGTAKLNKAILDSGYLKESFEINFLSLFKRINPTNRGKLGLANMIYNVSNIIRYSNNVFSLRPQLIYMSLSQNKLGFIRDSIFILIGKAFRRKLCVHFHGGGFNLFYAQQKGIFKKYISFVLRRIDRLILLAEKFRKQFNPFLKDKKIVFLYNCVPEIIDMSTKREKDISEGRKAKILFIGYISKAKGALDLVKSIPSVIENYKKPVEFILCGQPVDIERNIIFISNPHYGFTKINDFIINENISRYVKIYPEVNSAEKIKMFLDADIFVLPSYSEGCALVVLEAMAFGLPVITTPVGALQEMIKEGENCFFVEPGDVKGISEKILFMLNNPYLCKEMGNLNRQLVKDKYNSDIFLRKLSGIWNDILFENKLITG